jgi:hypothetical protein
MAPEPIGTAEWKEREFLGRKISTLNLGTNGINMVANGGYVAITQENAVLDEYLRSGEAPPKPLRDLPGLAEAAQRVGGFNSGWWFSFENEAETMRMSIEQEKNRAKDDTEKRHIQIGVGVGSGTETATRVLPVFLDYNSLPPFERIAKFFYYSLFSAASKPEGVSVKMSIPTPPALK